MTAAYLEPVDIHWGVVVCLDALASVVFTLIATPKNLCGNVGADEAKIRFVRFRDALENFPLKQLDDDPFAQAESFTLLVGDQHFGVKGCGVSLRLRGNSHN